MSEVIYNEDLVKQVSNKYLAVNVAAKRARDINANGLPVAPTNASDKKKKPVAIATQELIDGKLQFEKSEAKVPVPNTPSIFTDPQDSDDGSDIFDEELLAREQDTDAEEREEGL
ncbi:MAG: DNA-directed RNA polymerase subunit omega [Candidatus Poribacteria bacterium]|nr:DNA-directed RNA polymerase subunit omega [Candidatus Poribacteria bacterium]